MHVDRILRASIDEAPVDMLTRAAIVTGAVLTMASASSAQSRAWFVPAVSMSVSHDTNLFLTDNAGDTLAHVRPSFDAAYESPNREFHGFAAFEAQRSATYPALNMLGAQRTGLVDARVNTSPRMVLGLGGRHDRTDSPSELSLESGILLGRQIAARTHVTPSASYRLRPRTTVTGQYSWTHESLSGYPEQSLHAARAGMDYARSARTQWGGRFVARSFVGSSIDRESSHTLLATVSRQLTPATTASVHVGPRFSSYSGVRPEVLASLLRRTPRDRFLVDYWQGETIVLGVPGPVGIHSGTARTSWLLRNDLEISTVVGVFRSLSLADLRAIVYHGGVGGAWTVREMYTLTAAYRADYQRGDLRGQLPPDGHVTRGVVLVGVTIAPRLKRTVAPLLRDPALPMTGVLWP
jgi:hypothetical protein